MNPFVSCRFELTFRLHHRLICHTSATMARHRGPKRPPAEKKSPLTHFLCLPLVTPDSKPQLEASLRKFRNAVSSHGQGSTRQIQEACGIASEQQPETVTSGVHPKAIRPVGALHCTLGVMSLDRKRLDEAVELLVALDTRSLLKQTRKDHTEQAREFQEVFDVETKTEGTQSTLTKPISPPAVDRDSVSLSVDLKGLVSMHPPHNTSILYTAPADLSERLYPFCLAVQKLFRDKDLLVADDRKLKLHATIVNTIYAKGRKPERRRYGVTPGSTRTTGEPEGQQTGEEVDDRSQGHGPKANAPLKIDATVLLEEYKDFTWAENVRLDRIAICEMGAKKVTNAEGEVISEQYTEVASVALPS